MKKQNHTFIITKNLRTSQYIQTQQTKWLPTIFSTHSNTKPSSIRGLPPCNPKKNDGFKC
jgi:hypothetical protein